MRPKDIQKKNRNEDFIMHNGENLKILYHQISWNSLFKWNKRCIHNEKWQDSWNFQICKTPENRPPSMGTESDYHYSTILNRVFTAATIIRMFQTSWYQFTTWLLKTMSKTPNNFFSSFSGKGGTTFWMMWIWTNFC